MIELITQTILFITYLVGYSAIMWVGSVVIIGTLIGRKQWKN